MKVGQGSSKPGLGIVIGVARLRQRVLGVHDLEGGVFPRAVTEVDEAQALGRIMVIPSRAESLPYVVLEAAAAGLPLITTKVGGIPEIYGTLTDTLVPAEDVGALARTIARTLDHPDATAELAKRLQERVAASFSVDTMVDGVLSAYETAIARLKERGRR